MSKPITILYLDPEPNNLHAFSAWFRRKEGFECYTCTKEIEALSILDRYPVRVLLADQPLPGRTGMEILEELPPRKLPPVRIVLSAQRDLTELEKAVKDGVITAYFSKPVDFEALERILELSAK